MCDISHTHTPLMYDSNLTHVLEKKVRENNNYDLEILVNKLTKTYVKLVNSILILITVLEISC